MKIYVSVDMEGIAGILLPDQLFPGSSLYEEARKLLTKEVNVIVEALHQEGAKKIVVKDAHGRGFNFLVDDLHPEAIYCMGALRIDQRFPELDETFDAAMLIGYHAMGGTKHAIRDHTMTSTGWESLALNGRPIGEIGLDSLLFGLYHVPVIFVSGDDKTTQEAKETLENVTTYETKRAFGRHAGLMKAPKRVYEELPRKVAEAITKIDDCKPYKCEGPYTLHIKFLTTDAADQRFYDGKKSIRLNGLEAIYKDDDLERLFAKAL